MATDDKPPDYVDSLRSQAAAPTKKKISRRQWFGAALGIGGAGATAGIYTRYWEPDWLEVSRHQLPPEKFRVEKRLRFLLFRNSPI